MLTAGSSWPAVAARFSRLVPRLASRGETWRDSAHPRLGHSGSSPQDPPADLGKAPGLLAALPRVLGKPYIDLMTFGVWGSIEDACRG
jgi:hypothetical protein